jgi:hypothetical protein
MTRFDDPEDREEYGFRFDDRLIQQNGREHHMVFRPVRQLADGIGADRPATAGALRAMCDQKQTGKNNEA